MELVLKTNETTTTLLFYFEDKNSSLIYRFINIISDELLKNELVQRFRRIEFYFSGKINQIIDKEHIVGSYATILLNEVMEGQNKIYFKEDLFLEKVNKAFNIKIRYGLKDGEFNKVGDQKFVSFVVSAIYHEIGHLWQGRQNKTHQLLERNFNRIERAAKNLSQSSKLLSSEHKANVIYVRIRAFMFNLLEDIIYEGFAEYMKFYYIGQLKFNLENVLEVYNKSKNNSIIINQKFEKLFSLYIEQMNNPDEVKNFTKIIENLDHDLEQLSYHVGVHIYHLILYANSELKFEDVILWEYSKVLKSYEEACAKKNLKPVITIFSDKGIISYPKYMEKLKVLRNSNLQFFN